MLYGPSVRVPFANPGRETTLLRPALDRALARVLTSGSYILGAEGDEFEAEFAAFCEVEGAVGVASGTDAIELALRALGVGPGDEVITQANTCIPTVAAIERAGAAPVLCDVEERAGTMDLESAQAAPSDRTRAIVPVHLYGQCADVDALAELTLPVVEDCAQALGARLRGRTAGTMGVLGAFSFYPTKNLGALGDAGAVATKDPELRARLRSLRQYGQATRYEHAEHGVNSRLDEVQAGVLRVKLEHVAEANDRRRAIAAAYDAALEGVDGVRPLERLPDRVHAFHLYVVRASDRAAFQARLEAEGVATLVHYPRPVHGHPPYAQLGVGRDLGNAEALAREVVSVPLYPQLTDAEVEHVCTALGAA